MTSAVADIVERAGARGGGALVAGVLAAGRTSFHARGAVAGERTLFEIGSITKPFTGVLLADMAVRGEVSLEAPVSEFLPEAQLPRWPGRPPALEELATHRAGLPNTPRGIGRREAMVAFGLRGGDPWAGVDLTAYHGAVRATVPRRAPGGRSAYSSLGFGLLGDALCARAGASYEELLRERITSVLGLEDTSIEVPPGALDRLAEGRSRRGRPRPPLRDHMPAAGAIRSSARDLLRFLEASLTPPGDPPGPALGLAARPRSEVNKRLAIGLGWMILRRKGKPEAVFHGGGTWGYRSFAALVPETRTGVVVLGTTTRSVDRVGLRLLDATA